MCCRVLKDRQTAGLDRQTAGFGQTDSRFGQTDSRFGQTDSRFGQTDSRFCTVLWLWWWYETQGIGVVIEGHERSQRRLHIFVGALVDHVV